MALSKILSSAWTGIKFVARLVVYIAERRRSSTRPIAIVAQVIQEPDTTTVDLLPIAERAELQTEPLQELAAVERTVNVSSTQRRRKSQRGRLVEELLDEASQGGAVTYDEFILFVKEKTGEGCSRRIVASWKKERKLVNATT